MGLRRILFSELKVVGGRNVLLSNEIEHDEVGGRLVFCIDEAELREVGGRVVLNCYES